MLVGFTVKENSKGNRSHFGGPIENEEGTSTFGHRNPSALISWIRGLVWEVWYGFVAAEFAHLP